jgi:hypothetical protein
MARRLGLSLLMLALLGACNTLHCAERSQNNRSAGACGLTSTF